MFHFVNVDLKLVKMLGQLLWSKFKPFIKEINYKLRENRPSVSDNGTYDALEFPDEEI